MKTVHLFHPLWLIAACLSIPACRENATSSTSQRSSQVLPGKSEFPNTIDIPHTQIPSSPDTSAPSVPSTGSSRIVISNDYKSPIPSDVGLSMDWKSFQKTDLVDEAVRVVNKLIERFPDSPDAHEARARVLLLIGQTEEAKVSWLKCLELAPDYGYAFHGLGLIETKLSRFKEAIEYYKKALERIHNYKDSVRELSDAYLKDGQIELAAKSLEDFLTINPSDSEFWLRLGQTHNAGLNFAKAKPAFEKSLLLANDNPKAEQGLITALIRLGERERAKELAERVKSRPKRENDSIDQLLVNERIDISSRYWVAALVYRNFQCYAEAELLLERASNYDPKNTKVLEMLIEQLIKREEFESAFQKTVRLTELDVSNPSYAFGAASLAEKLKKVSDAAHFYRCVIELAPNDSKAYKQLTTLLLSEMRKPEEAEMVALSWKEKDASAVPLAFLASAQALQGKLRDAEVNLTKAVELDPASEELKNRLAQVKRALDNQP
ncbi:MAG: tetratricopeptide repeat protein [Pirellula sp.]|jgi:tetratricopeptide (TPR) repeat protein